MHVWVYNICYPQNASNLGIGFSELFPLWKIQLLGQGTKYMKWFRIIWFLKSFNSSYITRDVNKKYSMFHVKTVPNKRRHTKNIKKCWLAKRSLLLILFGKRFDSIWQFVTDWYFYIKNFINLIILTWPRALFLSIKAQSFHTMKEEI